MKISEFDLTSNGVFRSTSHRIYSGKMIVNSLFNAISKGAVRPYYEHKVNGLSKLDTKFMLQDIDNIDRGTFATGYTDKISHYHRISKFYTNTSPTNYCDRCGRLTLSHMTICNNCNKILQYELSTHNIINKIKSQ